MAHKRIPGEMYVAARFEHLNDFKAVQVADMLQKVANRMNVDVEFDVFGGGVLDGYDDNEKEQAMARLQMLESQELNCENVARNFRLAAIRILMCYINSYDDGDDIEEIPEIIEIAYSLGIGVEDGRNDIEKDLEDLIALYVPMVAHEIGIDD